MKKTTLIAALLAFAVALPTAAFALDDSYVNVPREQWLSPGQIAEKLSAQGYKVLEIEADDGAYEAEMLDKNGVKVETHVHPATGELLLGYDD